MRRVVQWLVSARLRAGLVAAILVHLVPPISGAVIALVTFERGFRAAVEVTVIAAGFWYGMLWLGQMATGLPFAGIGFAALALIHWGPVLFMAGMTARFGSLNLAWQVFAAVGTVGILTAFVAVDDLAVVAAAGIDEALKTAWPSLDGAQRAELGRLLPGLLVAMLMGASLIALALGRWAHRSLNDKPGIGPEFRRIRLGRALNVVAVLSFIAASVTGLDVFDNLTSLFFALLFLQGMSIVHYLTMEGGWSWLLLIISYVSLVLLYPISEAFFVALGLIDNVMDVRRRLNRKG